MPSSKPPIEATQQRHISLSAAIPANSRIIAPAKLRPPRGRPGYLVRARLIDALSHDIERQLTVVAAPAGYGKSTLVAQWLTRVSMPWAWIAIGPEDDTPRSLLKLIVAAVQTIDAQLVAQTMPLLNDALQLSDTAITDLLIDDLSLASRVFILVLDDTHFLESPEVWALILKLQQSLADIIRLVLIGRSEPNLPLARLRVAGEISQFGPEELAFTRLESIEYMAASNLALSGDDVELLYGATEGWVAALKLASIALVDLSAPQRHERLERMAGRSLPVLGSYLWQEVYDRQTPEIQSFLLHTSLLDRFCAELCDAVVGASDSGEMIRECGLRNLFIIPLDDSNTWFRFHHLVSDLLRTKVATTFDAGELRQIHDRASRWLGDRGYLEEAVNHAIAAADWERASQLVERICRRLFDRDSVHELLAALISIPRSVISERPSLAFYLAWAKARTGSWPESIAIIDDARNAWDQSSDPHEQGLLQLWHCLRCLTGIDAQGALDHGERALKLLTPAWPVEYCMALLNIAIAQLFCGHLHEFRAASTRLRQFSERWNLDWLALMERMYSSSALASEGKLAESTALASSVIAGAGRNRTAIWLQPTYLQIGLNYREMGLLDDALDALQTALQLAIATQSHLWCSRIHLAIAMVNWSMGDHEAALAELHPAMDFANRLGMIDHPRRVRAMEARFFLGLGQIELARRWAESANLDPSSQETYARQKEYLSYIRFLILDQRPDEALPIVLEMRRDAEVNDRYGDLIELGVLETLALRASGDSGGAVRALTPAIELSAREGYLQAFVDDGLDLAPVLRYLHSHGYQRNFIERLITVIEGSPAPPMPSQAGLIEELSQREMEVFRLVAEGHANREVGQRLFISEKTVKKHVSNILSKLGATNRTQAVEIGRRKQLI